LEADHFRLAPFGRDGIWATGQRFLRGLYEKLIHIPLPSIPLPFHLAKGAKILADFCCKNADKYYRKGV
jgi:hypothetical protein